MPKQKRWELKRDCDQVVAALDKASNYLAAMGLEFAPVHPEMNEQLQQIFNAIQYLIIAVNAFKDSI